MGGKKARERFNRAKRGVATAQPSPAVPPAPNDPPKPQARTEQQQEAEKRLVGYLEIALDGIAHGNRVWAANEFAGNVAGLAAAAGRGDARALVTMFNEGHGTINERGKWARMMRAPGNVEANLWLGLSAVLHYYTIINKNDGVEHEATRDEAMKLLRVPADRGFATAQHVTGMFMYCSQSDSGPKVAYLNAARWIRKAAMQELMDAQYELGEMFRHGVFCDHIYMRFTRNYIRRASVQGHVEAIARMQDLRSCVLCGADDALLACAQCHQARYCNSVCSEKHWCEGGGVGGGVGGGAGARHKDTCPRTYTRRSHDDAEPQRDARPSTRA